MKGFFDFYETVAQTVMPYFLAIGVMGSLVLLYNSMHFCYRYFIHTGNILVWGSTDEDGLDRL